MFFFLRNNLDILDAFIVSVSFGERKVSNCIPKYVSFFASFLGEKKSIPNHYKIQAAILFTHPGVSLIDYEFDQFPRRHAYGWAPSVKYQ